MVINIYIKKKYILYYKMFKDIKVEELVIYLMLIIFGYYIAKMFSRSCNGFKVGGRAQKRCR